MSRSTEGLGEAGCQVNTVLVQVDDCLLRSTMPCPSGVHLPRTVQ